MKNKITFLFVAIQFFIINNPLYSEENQESGVKFSNILSIEHFSDILSDDRRNEHSTLLDDPSFAFKEKFRIYFPLTGGDKRTGEINPGTDSDPSTSYICVNLVYNHNENFTIFRGMELALIQGDVRNPSFSMGIGYGYTTDMVFTHSGILPPNIYVKFGLQDDIHFYIDLNPTQLLIERDIQFNEYYDIDFALGYKKILPLFFRMNLYLTDSGTKIDRQYADIRYMYSQDFYTHTVMFSHLQYYGNSYGFSAGYILDYEKFSEVDEYKNPYEDTTVYENDKLSQGGGLTFYVKTAGAAVELFGEFHLLADKDLSWMTISKFGVKTYF